MKVLGEFKWCRSHGRPIAVCQMRLAYLPFDADEWQPRCEQVDAVAIEERPDAEH